MADGNITDSYTLQMLDKISAPLQKIERHMEKLNGTMDRLSSLSGSGGLTGTFNKLSAGTMALGAAVGVAAAGLAGLYKAMEFGIGLAARLSLAFGKAVIEASRFRTQNITSLDLFLGRGKGEPVFNRLLQIGALLPMDERDVVRQGQALASAGYKGQGLSAVNAALADVFALRGEQYRQNLEFHFLRLKNEAKPDARDVKMAAIDTGIGMEGVMTQLFKLKGVKAPSTIFGMEQLYESMKKSGRITGADVADAILHGINERYDEGKGLGTAARKLGEGTLSGLITNLEAAPERFLMQMKLEDMPGVKSLMEFIKRLLPFFDHGTEQGKKLTAVLERMVNVLFGGLDRITGKDLEHFFEGGIKVAEQLVEVVRTAWEWMDKLLHGNTGEFMAATMETIFQVGKWLGMGIWEGIKLAMSGKAEQERARLQAAGVSGYAANVAMGYTVNPALAAFAAQGRGIQGLSTMSGRALPAPDFIEPGAKDWAPTTGALAFAAQGRGIQGLSTMSGRALPAPDFIEPGAKDWAPTTGALPMPKLEEGGENIVEGVVAGMQRAGEMHSPSERTAREAENLVEGLILGLRRKAQQLAEGSGEMGDAEELLLQALRRMALRNGAPLTQGAG